MALVPFTRLAPALAVSAAVALLLAGCSGSPSDPLGNLSGCLAGESGTIAIGVSNSSGEPIVIEGVELLESSGVEITDRFIAIDEDARSTAVLFESSGRDSVGGVDLDRTAIEPGEAAYVGVEVERTGSAEGRVDGLLLTVDGDEQGAPVTLDLRDTCD
ncbi:MAG: hypothetical protein C0444_06880 [Microbacterium sp.]|nr:hypothetical protein [Microbacterium sp.]MBA4345733.1 hypothetical protein [Microbacterium sp.]